MRWHPIPLHSLCLSVERGALAWTHHEQRCYLISRTGTIYDFRSKGGLFLRLSFWNLSA